MGVHQLWLLNPMCKLSASSGNGQSNCFNTGVQNGKSNAGK
ncbi:hypothetical protein FB599_0435 [Herbaspirillum sp. SJZ130]|nr:hypothetical protein [Herbaspirillum sp. SJZ102]TQK13027.1 hypothetical protein FB599_0435 [Herbaspirillum sp. SJZ130]TQK15031.1 hypothetical protein FB598_0373 [Herbaspirillum sp. SJZ106]TWC67388.1 hypothetical protein FB597_104199 [Herbaspirillum sp. SJZ099]